MPLTADTPPSRYSTMAHMAMPDLNWMMNWLKSGAASAHSPPSTE